MHTQISNRDREVISRVRASLNHYGVLDPKLPSTFPQGSGIDLAVALQALQRPSDGFAVIGDLGFNGDVLPVRGILSQGDVLNPRAEYRHAIVPWDNRLEAAHAFSGDVYAVKTIQEAIDVVRGNNALAYLQKRVPCTPDPMPVDLLPEQLGEPMRRAASALKQGKVIHLQGRPGCGKTMVARRLVWQLPTLSYPEALLISQSASERGLLDPNKGLATQRPFRAPHHTASIRGLEGEAKLARHGILFLDDLQEFSPAQVRVASGAPQIRVVLASSPLLDPYNDAALQRYNKRLQQLLDLFGEVETIELPPKPSR